MVIFTVRVTQQWLSIIQDETLDKHYVLKLEFANGAVYYFSEGGLSFNYTDDQGDITNIHSEPGLLINDSISFSVDILQKNASVSSVNISLPGELRLQDLKKRIPISSGTGELSLIINSLDYKDRLILLNGKVRNPSWGTDDETFEFSFEDVSDENDESFPPVVISTDNWDYPANSSIGKPYPIIYGDKHGSLCYIVEEGALIDPDNHDSATARVNKLVVAGHNVQEVTDVYKNDRPTPITKNYAGASSSGWGGSALTTDKKGNTLFEVKTRRRIDWNTASYETDAEDPDYYTSSDKFCVDVKGMVRNGKLLENPGEIIEDILIYYSGLKKEQVDWASVGELKSRFVGWKFACSFNGSNENSSTALATINQRICGQIPAFMRHQSGKVTFIVTNYRHLSPVMHLQKDINIYQRISKITESDISEVFNDFSISYAYNNRFDNYEGFVEVNKENNRKCSISYMKYGKRVRESIQAPDIANDGTAHNLLRYYVDLYSDVSEIVSYECIPDVAYVQEGQLVTVTDSDLTYTDKQFYITNIEQKLDSCILTLRSLEI